MQSKDIGGSCDVTAIIKCKSVNIAILIQINGNIVDCRFLIALRSVGLTAQLLEQDLPESQR